MRRSGWILVGLGVLSLVAAVVLRFVVAPNATKLPADTDTVTTYSGTGSILNATALQQGDVANAVARNIPVTLDRHVYVSQTEGNTAIVHDDLTLKSQASSIDDNHTYAVDRTKLTEAPTIQGVQVEDHQGLTISLPADPDPKSDVYKYWDTPTRVAVPVRYVGTEKRGGRETYHYEAKASAPLTNPSLQQRLPSSLPRTLAPRLLTLLPADTQQRLTPLLSALPDQIPLSYTANSTYNVWADTKLGVPIDTEINRTIVANVSAVDIPLIPVLSIDVTEDQASVKAAADKASSATTKLTWLRTWGPFLLVILGLVLALLGLGRRKPPTTAAAEPPVGAAPRAPN